MRKVLFALVVFSTIDLLAQGGTPIPVAGGALVALAAAGGAVAYNKMRKKK